ncbi:hypothetical protein ACAG24_004420 [Mycobacterium sp. pW049]|uniref:hypothetical protein n=1 Tax=[Mycobacterium] bulgaricum TaxID=3238985 RepID=UPI0035A824EE
MNRRDTPPPGTDGSEKDTLVGFLDYLRSRVAAKLASPRCAHPACRQARTVWVW